VSYERGWDNELGSGDVWIRPSAVVVHFGSPDGTAYVPRQIEPKKKWWQRALAR